ncbi:MAG TPA: hypothetical protein PKD25_15780, partial [Rubrivivax sp.]|nr:hypothetical protein [Rubrivivax sp.]
MNAAFRRPSSARPKDAGIALLAHTPDRTMSCSPPSATARSSAAIAGPAPSAARGRRVVDAPTRVIHG